MYQIWNSTTGMLRTNLSIKGLYFYNSLISLDIIYALDEPIELEVYTYEGGDPTMVDYMDMTDKKTNHMIVSERLYEKILTFVLPEITVHPVNIHSAFEDKTYTNYKFIQFPNKWIEEMDFSRSNFNLGDRKTFEYLRTTELGEIKNYEEYLQKNNEFFIFHRDIQLTKYYDLVGMNNQIWASEKFVQEIQNSSFTGIRFEKFHRKIEYELIQTPKLILPPSI